MLDRAAAFGALGRYDEHARAPEVRYEALEAALAERLPDFAIATGPRGGWSCWIRLPAPLADELGQAAQRHGLIVTSGSGLAPDGQFVDHIRLCHVADEALLQEGVARLARAWQEVA